jgi:hypothetical protein
VHKKPLHVRGCKFPQGRSGLKAYRYQLIHPFSFRRRESLTNQHQQKAEDKRPYSRFKVSRMSSEDDNIELILQPIDADVLCGRGRAIRTHAGNQLYISLIQDKKTEYSDAAKGWKQGIVREVFNAIRDKKGRFLQRQGNYWMDIGEQKALAKTAQAFRDFKSEDDDGCNGVKRKNPSLVVASKKSKGRPSFLSHFGGGMRPRLAKGGEKLDSSSSSSEASDQPRQDDEDASSKSSSDDDDGDVSETETEDSFPVYRGK